MITVRVTYNRADIPESLMVKGEEMSPIDLRIHLDKLIDDALTSVGMKWNASGTLAFGESLERDIEFDCDLEKILNAPAEWEINAEFAQAESKDAEVFAVT